MIVPSILLMLTSHTICSHPLVAEQNTELEQLSRSTESTKKTKSGISSYEILQVTTIENIICSGEVLNRSEYTILPNDDVFVYTTNKTYRDSLFFMLNGQLCLAEPDNAEPQTKEDILHCKKWIYEPDEFRMLENGSILLYDEILKEGTYELRGNRLYMCIPDDDSNTDNKPSYRFLSEATMIIIGKVGTIISVIALTCHLVVFCIVPSLRNLPGYNLTSLSTAFLLAYCFVIIGQIKEVLGMSCIVSGILVQYFFLSAFFWMNTMTFDVWRALRLATKKLVSTSGKVKAKKFALYCTYSWGIPLVITSISVAMDNVDGIPEEYRPSYGKNDICWINSDNAKLLFFVGPAFVLFVINGIFFAVSAYIIVTNTMSDPGDQQRTARRNFTLYVRMGLIMGITWSIGIISVLLKREELWFVFDLLNSLQGLFVFLFFTCSRKVWKHFKAKTSPSETKSTSVQNSSTTK